MSQASNNLAPSIDGTTVYGNGKMRTPPNEEGEDIHRYVTDDAPRVRKEQIQAIRGSGQQTNAAGLIVSLALVQTACLLMKIHRLSNR